MAHLLARGSHVDRLPVFAAVVVFIVEDAAVGDHVVRYERVGHEVPQAYAFSPAQRETKSKEEA